MQENETAQFKTESVDGKCYINNPGVHFSNLAAKEVETLDSRLTTVLFYSFLPITVVLIIVSLIVQKYWVFWYLLGFWTVFRISLLNLTVPQKFVDFSTSILFVLLKVTFFSLWATFLHDNILVGAYILSHLIIDSILFVLCWDEPSYFYIGTLAIYLVSTVHEVLAILSNGAYTALTLIITLWVILLAAVYFLRDLKLQIERNPKREETIRGKWVRKMSQVVCICCLNLYTLTGVHLKSSCAVYPMWILQWVGFVATAYLFLATFRSPTSAKFWTLLTLICVEIAFVNIIFCNFSDDVFNPLLVAMIFISACFLSGLSLHPTTEASNGNSRQLAIPQFSVYDVGRLVLLAFFIAFTSLVTLTFGFLSIDYVQNAFGCSVRKANYCSGQCETVYDPHCTCVRDWQMELDDDARLNESFFIGAHNSYHRRSWISSMLGSLDYELPSLSAMLTSGLRELELDIHWETTHFRVYHIRYTDYHTTCSCLYDCLSEMAAWSRKNPNHSPVILHFDPKDFCHLSGASHVFRHLSHVVNSFFSEKILTPSQLRRNEPSLIVALKNHGWPKIKDLRGKFIFNLLFYKEPGIGAETEMCRHVYYGLNEKYQIFFDRVQADHMPHAYDSNFSVILEPSSRQPIFRASATGLLIRYRLYMEVETTAQIRTRHRQTPFQIFTYEKFPSNYYVHPNQSQTSNVFPIHIDPEQLSKLKKKQGVSRVPWERRHY